MILFAAGFAFSEIGGSEINSEIGTFNAKAIFEIVSSVGCFLAASMCAIYAGVIPAASASFSRVNPASFLSSRIRLASNL